MDANYLDGDRSLIYNNMAVEMIGSNQHAKAMRYLNKAIEYDPHDATAYYNKGLIYDNIHKRRDALIWYKKSLSINSSYIKPIVNIAIIYKSMGKMELAQKYIKRAYYINKSDVDILYNMADIYYETGNYRKAKEVLFKAKSIKTDDWKIYCSLGNVFYQIGQYKKAEMYYLKADTIMPNNIYIKTSLSRLKAKTGNESEAYALLNSLTHSAASSNEQKKLLAYSYWDIGKYTEALLLLKRIAQYNKEDDANYYDIACIYSILKKRALAIRYLNKAIKLNRNNIDISKKDRDLEFIRQTDDYKNILRYGN